MQYLMCFHSQHSRVDLRQKAVMHDINLPIRGLGKAKSTPSTPLYPTSHSIQKSGVGSFDAPRRVGLGT